MKFRVLVLTIIALTLGCSDFLNNKTGSSDKGSDPFRERLTNNPFPEGFDPNSESFSEYNMLANIGLNVIQPKTKTLRLQVEVLQSKLSNLCQTLEDGENSQFALESAQMAWKEAMLAFHALDATPIGPQLERGNFIGDSIYRREISSCGVDVEVERMAREGTEGKQLLSSLKGLGSVEYMLFEPQLLGSCPPRYVKVKEWETKSLRDKKLDRCRYAIMVTKEISLRAKELEDAWDKDKSNYSKILVEDKELYPDLKAAVTAMSDALFGIEDTKDYRLGAPLGFHADCTNTSGKCLDKVEHPWSGLALEAVKVRIKGFQHVFWGSLNPSAFQHGFDDYLRQINRGEVADELTAKSTQALQSLEPLLTAGTLSEQIDSLDIAACRPESTQVPLCAFYQQVRQVSNALKIDFLTALSLRAPPTRTGDMD